MMLSAAAAVLWLNIPAGDAAHTVVVWGRQVHMGVGFDPRLLAPVRSVALNAAYGPLEGLRIMLRYTHLRVMPVAPGRVLVVEDQPYCHPEWGAQAPLPPCVPQPLTVRYRSDTVIRLSNAP